MLKSPATDRAGVRPPYILSMTRLPKQPPRMTPTADDRIPPHIIEAASAWFMRFRDRAPDAAERARLEAEFEAWLAADPVHQRAFELAGRAWALAGKIPEADAANVQAGKLRRGGMAPSSGPAMSARARQSARGPFPATGRRRFTTPKRIITASAGALILCALFAPTLMPWLRADFATATAETRRLSLADGSHIVLGAQSALARDFSSERRELALLRGTAWFEVARDDARPFVVSAGGITIRVTGTAFDVALTERALTIALASGSVEVKRAGKAPLQKTLKPGQRLAIDRQDGAVHLSQVDPARMGAWRDGRLIVHGARLAEVVATIDRYYPGTIMLIDRALRERRVTGVFDLKNPHQALRSLLSPYAAAPRKLTPWHTLVSGK